MNKQLLYFDDLTVGDSFMSEACHITADKIKTFAKEYDPQVFHLDEEAAEDTFFKGLAASGWHTAAVTMRLITKSIPFSAGIIGAGGDIKWPHPTRPGDVLHVKSTIKEIKPSRSKPNQAIVVIEAETINHQQEVCQILTANLLSFKKMNNQ